MTRRDADPQSGSTDAGDTGPDSAVAARPAVNADTYPADLRERAQWLTWKPTDDGRKVPRAPHVHQAQVDRFVSAQDPDMWTAFDDARQWADRLPTHGLAFTIPTHDERPDDPHVLVDYDDVRDPETGELTDQAKEIVEQLDSYAEVSPSGMGVHVIVEGKLPGGRNRSGDVELYAAARYFTMTGAHLSVTPSTIAARSDALAAVHADVVADKPGAKDGEEGHEPGESPPETMGTGIERFRGDQIRGDSAVDPAALSDGALLERAREATNGTKFQRLWRGDTSGYPSQSEADMALCCLLAFWTGGDAQQMDRLFRESGLMCEKWDETHYADGATYGEQTIERAVAGVSEYYDPEAADGLDSMTEPPGTGGAGQRHAHLAEKNRLLTERVAELETKLEAKEARIAELEAELDRFDGR